MVNTDNSAGMVPTKKLPERSSDLKPDGSQAQTRQGSSKNLTLPSSKCEHCQTASVNEKKKKRPQVHALESSQHRQLQWDGTIQVIVAKVKGAGTAHAHTTKHEQRRMRDLEHHHLQRLGAERKPNTQPVSTSIQSTPTAAQEWGHRSCSRPRRAS